MPQEIRGEFTCICGPYEGLIGKATCEEGDVFHGEIMGIDDVVTFQGKTPGGVRRAFREAVDDYLAMCKEAKKAPEKPFSGKLNVRFSPDLHRKIQYISTLRGVSINQFIVDTLTQAVEDAIERRVHNDGRRGRKINTEREMRELLRRRKRPSRDE